MAVSAARSSKRNDSALPTKNESSNEAEFKPERDRPSLPLIVGGMAVAVLIGLTTFTVLGSSTSSAPSPTLFTNSNRGSFPSSSPSTPDTPGAVTTVPTGAGTVAPATPGSEGSDPVFDEPASPEVVSDSAAGSLSVAPTEVVFGEAADATAPPSTALQASPVNDAATVLIVPDGAPLPTP